MSTTIIGFPRLGEFRELKFTTEKYFRNEITADELLTAAKDLRAKHWNIVKEKGISEIPSNDFSHYDNFLDAAFLFNVVPESVQNLDLTDLERYFALARGYQGEKGDVRALPMKNGLTLTTITSFLNLKKQQKLNLLVTRFLMSTKKLKNWALTHVQLSLDHLLSFNYLTLKMV